METWLEFGFWHSLWSRRGDASVPCGIWDVQQSVRAHQSQNIHGISLVRAASLYPRTWGVLNPFGWTAPAVSVCRHTDKQNNFTLENQLLNTQSIREQVPGGWGNPESSSHHWNGWESCKALETPQIHLDLGLWGDTWGILLLSEKTLQFFL